MINVIIVEKINEINQRIYRTTIKSQKAIHNYAIEFMRFECAICAYFSIFPWVSAQIQVMK